MLCTASDIPPIPEGLGQRRAKWQGTYNFLPRVQVIPHTVLGGGSTHLAGVGKPGSGLLPRRAPRCCSSPPAWSALAGCWCTVERGPENQISVQGEEEMRTFLLQLAGMVAEPE